MRKILSVLTLLLIMTSCFHKETPLDNHKLQIELADKVNGAKHKLDYLQHQWKEIKDEKMKCPLCRSDDLQFIEGYNDPTLCCKSCGMSFAPYATEGYRDKRSIQIRMNGVENDLYRLNRDLKEARQRSNGETNYIFNFWGTFVLLIIGMVIVLIYKHIEI